MNFRDTYAGLSDIPAAGDIGITMLAVFSAGLAPLHGKSALRSVGPEESCQVGRTALQDDSQWGMAC
ncbi:MAG: hypothetical protein JNL51_03685 [Chitinophagaceae bacterium]|nr:hypothetical protein [Chitinophagaceae bacterium]